MHSSTDAKAKLLDLLRDCVSGTASSCFGIECVPYLSAEGPAQARRQDGNKIEERREGEAFSLRLLGD